MVAKLLFYLAKTCYMLPLLLLLVHRFADSLKLKQVLILFQLHHQYSGRVHAEARLPASAAGQ